jgi:aspartate aminotransferase
LRDDVDVAAMLLERARVAVVPGSAFHAPGYVRLSFATDQAQLDRAVERIAEALARP